MAAKRADVWPRKKNGKLDSWYFRKLRLKTKDADEARRRARLSREGKWPPKEDKAAEVSAQAFTFDPPPAAPAPPPPPASSPTDPPPAAPPPISGEWTKAAAAASAETKTDGQAPPPQPEQLSSEQLADLVVSLQLKGTEVYVQQKYFEAFIAPQIAPEGRAILVGAYRQMFEYAGSAIQLPPWVNGLVVPALTVAVSSMAIVAGFREIALEQKQAAARTEGGA